MRKEDARKIIWVAFTLFLVLFVLSIMFASFLRFEVDKYIETYGSLAVFIASFLLEFVPQYISGHVAMISAHIFGADILVNLFSVLTGAVLGSSLGFAVGQYYGLDLINKVFNEKRIERIKSLLNQEGKWFVLISAISPLPYIPMIFGALHLSKSNFLIYGIFPRIASYIVVAFALYYGFYNG
ncbi:MAG: VTT domain-containing protein [Nanoarchaeota archaeon]